MESKTIMKRNLQFYKPPNCKYECIAFIMPNECIGDNEIEYTPKTEGYATLMSSMNESYAMQLKEVKKYE